MVEVLVGLLIVAAVVFLPLALGRIFTDGEKPEQWCAGMLALILAGTLLCVAHFLGGIALESQGG